MDKAEEEAIAKRKKEENQLDPSKWMVGNSPQRGKKTHHSWGFTPPKGKGGVK